MMYFTMYLRNNLKLSDHNKRYKIIELAKYNLLINRKFREKNHLKNKQHMHIFTGNRHS